MLEGIPTVTRLQRSLILLLAGALLASCAPVQTETAETATQASAAAENAQASTAPPIQPPAAEPVTSARELAEREEIQTPEPVIYYGNDKQVKMPPKRPPVRMMG